MQNQASLQETKQHGAVRFPFNLYPCAIPGDFPQVALHWQESMELVFVKRGIGLVQVGAVTCPARMGDIFIFTPGTLHALRQAEGQCMEYENIIFELELLGGAAAACLREVEEANRAKLPGYELLVKGALLRFLSLLIAQGKQQLPAETADTQRLKAVLQWLSAHYAEVLRVADAAGVCSFSASHFMRWFRQMTGQSFVAFLNEYRLNAAAEALQTTDETVLTIASRCGFENLSYFNRAFKAHFGMTPREYRKK